MLGAHLLQILRLQSVVEMKEDDWFEEYAAYRKEVDEAFDRHSKRVNCWMLAATVLLTIATGWQCYEAHQQTVAMRATLAREITTQRALPSTIPSK